VEVSLQCDGDVLELRVADDGRGLDAAPAPRAGHGHGLKNLITRARDWGGACEITSGTDGGTVLVWRVPCEVGTFSPPG
jgi:signal transduction histidine kinase